MSKEVPLQYDLFTGELVDARSPKEKRRDKKLREPHQTEMFTQKDLAQFGVRAKPQLPLSPKTHLELAALDPRTEEEKEYDRMRAAEAQTYSYLDKKDALASQRTKLFLSGLRLPLTEVDDPELGFAIQLTENINVLFWSNPNEEYERLRSEMHLAGNEVYAIGDNQLEIGKSDQTDLFLITYSDMEMIENVERLTRPCER